MPPRSPNPLAGPYVERAAHRRKDEAHEALTLAIGLSTDEAVRHYLIGQRAKLQDG